MPGKLREIKTAPKARPALLKRKLAGAALVAALSVSCAPETIQVTAKSPIRITAVQPRAEEPKNPRWVAFSEKYSLTDKEMSLIEDIFTLEQDKTDFWPSDVFEVLMGNSTLRKNHLEKSCRLVSSVLKRTDSLDDAINALGTLEYLFKGQKVGSTELDIVLDLVEGGPDMSRDKMRTLYNTAAMFRSDSYSPEFLQQMQRFLTDGDVMGHHVPPKVRRFVLDAFHGFSTKEINHSEAFAAMDEVLKTYSEISAQLAKEAWERAGKAVGERLSLDEKMYYYLAIKEKHAAVVILSSFTNPNFDQQMFDNLIFQLNLLASSEYVGTYNSIEISNSLAKLYQLHFFDSRVSSALSKYFKKRSLPYGTLGAFLKSALLVLEGKNFRSSYGSYRFVEALEDLKDISFMLERSNWPSKLSDAAKALAAAKQYHEMLELLKFSIKNAGSETSYAIDGLYSLARAKCIEPRTVEEFKKSLDFLAKRAGKNFDDAMYALEAIIDGGNPSPRLFVKFIEISKKILRNRSRKNKNAMFGEFFVILDKSKNQQVSMDNVLFLLGQKRANANRLFILLANSAEQGVLSDDVSFQKKFEWARHIAKEAGAKYKNPEVCLNFAYALELLGEKRTVLLHKDYGIEYFGRYPKELLEELLRSEHPRHRKSDPIAFVIYNKNDWNGAFYQSADLLLKLMKTHKIFIIEVKHDREISKRIGEFLSFHKSRFGGFFTGGKIDTLLIGGHGNPKGIRLGLSKGSSSRITSSDMKMLKMLRQYFSKKPTVILESCSTGRGEYAIGARISRALGARLFAPRRSGSLKNIELGEDGKVLGVEYTVPGNEFDSGRIKREEE